MADIRKQGQTVNSKWTNHWTNKNILYPPVSQPFSTRLRRHLGSICGNLYHLKVRRQGWTHEPGMRSKMAASEVCHERIAPDGPKKEKHTRTFQHVAISDKDTVACAHTQIHREALSDLGSTVVWRSGGTGREHLRTSNLNTDTLVFEMGARADTAHTKYSNQA